MLIYANHWLFSIKTCPVAAHYGLLNPNLQPAETKSHIERHECGTGLDVSHECPEIQELENENHKKSVIIEQLGKQLEDIKLQNDSESDLEGKQQLEYEVQYLKGKILNLQERRPAKTSSSRERYSRANEKPVLNFFF